MNNKGFTLVELLATLVLLGIIATISYVSINSVIEKNKESNCIANIDTIKSAFKLYVSDNRYEDNFENDLKDNENILQTLIENKYLNGDLDERITDISFDYSKGIINDLTIIGKNNKEDYCICYNDLEEHTECK